MAIELLYEPSLGVYERCGALFNRVSIDCGIGEIAHSLGFGEVQRQIFTCLLAAERNTYEKTDGRVSASQPKMIDRVLHTPFFQWLAGYPKRDAGFRDNEVTVRLGLTAMNEYNTLTDGTRAESRLPYQAYQHLAREVFAAWRIYHAAPDYPNQLRKVISAFARQYRITLLPAGHEYRTLPDTSGAGKCIGYQCPF